MIDTRLRLTVLTSVPAGGETFTDWSDVAVDFGRDTFSVTLDTDSLVYLGYVKPFSAVYVNLSTANTNAATLAWEYWNGTDWAALTAYDRTKGLTHSGFLTWERPANWTSSTVNGAAGYFVRLSPSVLLTSTVVAGLNLVFADDYDLQTEFAAVSNPSFIPEGETSHIKSHVAVRNQLIQDLRNKGAIKTDADGVWQNLTPWDLHDIEEVRQAATFLALAKIFFNFSDNVQDAWTAKSKYYDNKYKAAIDLVKVSYDADDDGEVDTAERATVQVTRLFR